MKSKSPLPCKNLIQLKKIKMPNKTELQGNWNEMKGKLKLKFAKLTDDDLLDIEGKKDIMLEKIQVKLGKTKEELREIIDGLWPSTPDLSKQALTNLPASNRNIF